MGVYYNPDTGTYEDDYDLPSDAPWRTSPGPGNPEDTNWTPGLVADLGDSESQNPFPNTSVNPPTPYTPPPTTGKTPQQIEAEGRAFDAERGYIGGYMSNGLWVNGSPSSGGGGGGGGGGGFSSGGDFDASGFQWPQFNAPRFSGPATPFSHADFQAPEFGDIFNDPSYKGRRDEGLQAIEHGAAARGLTRLPQTLKALGAWNQDFASREYGNIFDRSAQTYDRNRGNAADTYATNYGVSRDIFDREYKGAYDEFDMNAFQPAKLSFEDMYRRFRDELDSTTRIATAGFGDNP